MVGFGDFFSRRQDGEQQSAKPQAPTKAPAKPSTSSSASSATSGAAQEAKIKASAAMDQIKVIITGDKSSAPASGLESVTSSCPSLTKKQRLAGFACCFVIGYVISFGVSRGRSRGD